MKYRFRKLFIPHEENGFRPDFLERFSIGIMLVLVLLTFAMANIQALFWVSSDWLVSSVLPSSAFSPQAVNNIIDDIAAPRNFIVLFIFKFL